MKRIKLSICQRIEVILLNLFKNHYLHLVLNDTIKEFTFLQNILVFCVNVINVTSSGKKECVNISQYYTRAYTRTTNTHYCVCVCARAMCSCMQQSLL